MREKNKHKSPLYFFLGLIFGINIFIAWNVAKIRENQEILSPVVYPYEYGVELEEPKETILLQGKVSYYSKEGCLGCRTDQIMANGEMFNEDAFTIAVGIEEWYLLNDKWYGIPTIPLNTHVIVRNLGNGKEVKARVTDTGGFNTEEYKNRIADLSKATAEALEIRTDSDEVQILLDITEYENL